MSFDTEEISNHGDVAVRPRELRDPRAMRALAHPLRLELLDALAREGTLTATRAAELTGESAASCSFHLRQLAKYGFIDGVPVGAGRERPWRIAQVDLRWSADGGEHSQSASLLSVELLRRDVGLLERYLTQPDGDEPEWRQAAVLTTSLLFLTLDELRKLEREIMAIVERYLDRTAEPNRRPDGARPIRMLNAAFPLETEAHRS
jgi:DNA-binding transcriptional ArsR family regulator